MIALTEAEARVMREIRARRAAALIDWRRCQRPATFTEAAWYRWIDWADHAAPADINFLLGLIERETTSR